MSCAELLKKELKREFPTIDRDLQTYVESENRKFAESELNLKVLRVNFLN